MLGWNRWDLDIKSDKVELVKTIVKKEKKVAAKIRAKAKADEAKKIKQEEEQAKINAQIEKEKALQKEDKLKDPKCSHVSSKGSRCKISVANAGDKCTVHETVPQRVGGEKTQCTFMKQVSKKRKKRCGMQTSNKSGLCYYHD